jgi:hypothetical protein
MHNLAFVSFQGACFFKKYTITKRIRNPSACFRSLTLPNRRQQNVYNRLCVLTRKMGYVIT